MYLYKCIYYLIILAVFTTVLISCGNILVNAFLQKNYFCWLSTLICEGNSSPRSTLIRNPLRPQSID